MSFVIAITIEARQQRTRRAIVAVQRGGIESNANGYSSSGSSGVGASIPARSESGADEYQST